MEKLKAAEARIMVHINRCNAGWADAASWRVPEVWTDAEMSRWFKTDMSNDYRIQMQKKLGNGQVWLHLGGGGGSINMQRLYVKPCKCHECHPNRGTFFY